MPEFVLPHTICDYVLSGSFLSSSSVVYSPYLLSHCHCSFPGAAPSLSHSLSPPISIPPHLHPIPLLPSPPSFPCSLLSTLTLRVVLPGLHPLALGPVSPVGLHMPKRVLLHLRVSLPLPPSFLFLHLSLHLILPASILLVLLFLPWILWNLVVSVWLAGGHTNLWKLHQSGTKTIPSLLHLLCFHLTN